jgi:hypothetical protein
VPGEGLRLPRFARAPAGARLSHLGDQHGPQASMAAGLPWHAVRLPPAAPGRRRSTGPTPI